MVEEVTGQMQVRQLFKIGKVGTIAGGMVISGSLAANNPVRLLRNSAIIFEGKISSMKRLKNDVKEVANGFECGISIQNYDDVKEGDIIEGYRLVEKK
jgi:translation initiation factor IF-2